VAVSVAAQQHGLVLTDDSGVPLRPAKLWNDTESDAMAKQMVSDLGVHTWTRLCGSVPVAAFTITKYAWMMRHEPDVVRSAAKLFLPHDWLTFNLSGAHVTDRGDASGTGWYDPSDPAEPNDPRAVPDRLVDAALGHGAPGSVAEVEARERFRGLLPRVLGPAEPAGTITAAAAAELGLPEGVLVGPGTGDNMAAAVGLGLGFGDVVFSLGTSGTVYTLCTEHTADDSGAVAGFADATGWFLPLVCTLNATKVTDTVAGWLGTDVAGIDELALRADPRSPSVPTLVPYFDGERTPDLPDATGSIAGLRNNTTRAEFALAAVDGVLGGLIEGREALRGAGALMDGRTFLVGGGAHSAAYRQRLADLSGSAVIVPDDPEAVATGAAAQAAVVLAARESNEPGQIPYDALPAFAAVAAKWGLGKGTSTHPRP
jgi:xylulokinase